MKPWAVLCLCLPVAAAAECTDVRGLAAYVTTATGLSGLPDCLEIDRTAFALRPGLMLSQAGAYDPATDRIALAPDLNLDTVLGQSFLVHELVHMAQFRNHQPAACPAVREAAAYAVQIGFLRAHGEGREAMILSLATQGMLTCRPFDPGY